MSCPAPTEILSDDSLAKLFNCQSYISPEYKNNSKQWGDKEKEEWQTISSLGPSAAVVSSWTLRGTLCGHEWKVLKKPNPTSCAWSQACSDVKYSIRCVKPEWDDSSKGLEIAECLAHTQSSLCNWRGATHATGIISSFKLLQCFHRLILGFAEQKMIVFSWDRHFQAYMSSYLLVFLLYNFSASCFTAEKQHQCKHSWWRQKKWLSSAKWFSIQYKKKMKSWACRVVLHYFWTLFLMFF